MRGRKDKEEDKQNENEREGRTKGRTTSFKFGGRKEENEGGTLRMRIRGRRR